MTKKQKLEATLLDLKNKLTNLIVSKNLHGLHPRVQREAVKVMRDMEAIGLPVKIMEGYRSIERQNELYAQGRTKAGLIVTNAKGGQSFHNYGVAVDMCFKDGGYNVPSHYWLLLGKAYKKHGFEWGGDWETFQDRPHGEMKLGYTLADFQNRTVDYSKYK
jgi:peptidoglycan L-alanyl-D-glutamate endopeptidase CwlK